MSGWYPVALSAGLDAGCADGTRLFGQELVVWRDEAGVAHVWEDRCPHRGMRLSFGFVRGERIACLYHGWQFGPEGRCVHIPAHPALKVPGTIRAGVQACIERAGIVWTAMDPAGPPPDDVATIPVRSLALRVPAVPAAGALGGRPDAPVIRLAVGGQDVIAAVQPLSERESVIHLLMTGVPAERAKAQADVSAWAETLRRRVEAR